MSIVAWDISDCEMCRDDEFEALLSSINYKLVDTNSENDKLDITPIRIVSVVVCAELPNTTLDLEKISEFLKTEGEAVLYNKTRPARQEKRKMFYNCMQWKIQVIDGVDAEMNVTIKCFPNGKFQYAGFNTMHAIQLVTRLVTNKIRHIEGAMTPATSKINEPKIIQINSTFYILKDKTKWQLKQLILNRLLLEEEHISKGGNVISSTFMPEKYPGINVKFQIPDNPDRKVTLLIFATGSVLINGYYDLNHYSKAYNMLCSLVIRHQDELITENLLS